MSPQLDDLEKVITAGVENIRHKLAPNDDWLPTLFLMNARGKAEVIGLDIPFPQAKDYVYSRAVPRLIQQHRAVLVGTVNTAWTMARTPEQFSPDERVSEAADRREAVVLGLYAKTGQIRILQALITRHPDRPPDLDSWQRHDYAAADVSGLIGEAIRAALQAA